MDVFIHQSPTPPAGFLDVLKAWLPLLLPAAIAAVSWWYARSDRARTIKATLATQIMNLHDSLQGELEHARNDKNKESWFVVLPYLDRDVFPLVTSGRVSQQVAQQVVRMHFAYRAALATIAQISTSRSSNNGIDDLLVIDLSNQKDRKNYVRTLEILDLAAQRALFAIGKWTAPERQQEQDRITASPPPQ